MASSIFHYTDTNGLLGILDSDSLYATDYRFLNDSTEAGSIRDLIIPIFQTEIAEVTPQLIQNKWLKKEFYDEHGFNTNRLEADSLYEAFIRTMNNVSPLFVTSFCRHEAGAEEFAHGLLSQWRSYSSAGGFAIEFDENALDEAIRAEAKEYAYAVLRSNDVHYRNFEKVFDPAEYRGIAGEMIRKIFELQQIDVSKVTGRKDIDGAMLTFIQSAPFLKNSAFHEEREYRIVACCIRPKKVPKGQVKKPKEFKFRPKGDVIVPYIELFEDVGVLPIKSIVVGPHPSQAQQEEALMLALESTGRSDVAIRRSGIPYRR